MQPSNWTLRPCTDGRRVSTFEVLLFRADRTAAPDILYMALEGGPIEEKDCTRDLGVQVGPDLMFSAQVDHAVAAGSCMAGWVLRSFVHRSRGVMMALLRSLIQPRLDYCSQLWAPPTPTRAVSTD